MLQLTEWQRSEPLRLTHAQRLVLERHFNATVESASAPELVHVTSGSIVGTLRVDDGTVTVTPKIPIDRVLFMTAFIADPFRWERDAGSLGRVDDLVAGLARLFMRTSDGVLATGILRDYRQERDDLPYVRGRVDWRRQSRRSMPIPLALSYQVHDDDIVENQIVRSAIAVLRSLVPASAGADVLMGLNRVWRIFRVFRVLNNPLTELNRLPRTRRNEHYRPLLSLCRIVLENSMTELHAGSVPVSGFTLNMPDVFEQFVRKGLEHHSGLKLTALSRRPLTLDIAKQIDLHPDLVASDESGWFFVGDVKYKWDSGKGKNPDLYQLLSYATAANLKEATLIYAHGPGHVTQHRVRYADVILRVVRLDLRQPPAQVLRQLADVAASVGIGQDDPTRGGRSDDKKLYPSATSPRVQKPIEA
ncbi:McrC family protein [Arthrobacter pigmenti]